MTEREKVSTSFIDLDHWKSELGQITYRAPDLRMKNSGPGVGGCMIDDRCRCGRHVNIPKYLDILLIIMLSQSILIRPLKSLIGVNNWRRCAPPWCRCNVMNGQYLPDARSSLRKIRDLLLLLSRREKWSFAVSDWNWWDCKLMFSYYDIRIQEMKGRGTKSILLTCM